MLDSLTVFNDSENIFKDFLSPSVNYWERLRFYSLSHFFIKYGIVKDDNKTIFNNWLRVTKNLINNTLIQSVDNYKDAIRSINELSEHISDIYSYLSTLSSEIKYFPKLQREEEGIKSSLILEDAEWETLFKEIEQHSYFNGQIGFILKYSRRDDKEYDKEVFKDYSEKLSQLFCPKFRESNNFLFQRALLTKGDYLPQVGNSENYTFCVFEEALRTKLDNWRKVFNNNKSTFILKSLLDNIDKDNIVDDLKNIIKTNSVEDWRKVIIENPENISYCQYRQIRWYSDDEIYLLSKKQMNGRHREIYSWDLFVRNFKDKVFEPFAKPNYWESTSWDSACIYLDSFNYKLNEFYIDIIYDASKTGFYKLYFGDRNENPFSKEIEEMLEESGFNDNMILLPEDDIEFKINEICNKLKKLK